MFKGIGKEIKVSGDGLDMWFKAKIEKYPNSRTKEALESVWMMMEGSTVHDDSLKTFFEKDLTA